MGTLWSLSAWYSALSPPSTRYRTCSRSSTTSTLTPTDSRCTLLRTEATRNSVKRCSRHTRVQETGSVPSHEQHNVQLVPGTKLLLAMPFYFKSATLFYL